VKFLLAGLLTACCISSAFAQSGGWKLTKVEAPNKSVAGFIYHTESVGTQTSGSRITKAVTGLRLVCSGPEFIAQGTEVPLIAIYWNTMQGGSQQSLNVRVDGKTVELGQAQQWRQDGQLLYRPLSESAALIQAMKLGRAVSFEWNSSDGSKRQTVFNLGDFRSDLAEFNTSCKTQI
jgi:hypothetical protein